MMFDDDDKPTLDQEQRKVVKKLCRLFIWQDKTLADKCCKSIIKQINDAEYGLDDVSINEAFYVNVETFLTAEFNELDLLLNDLQAQISQYQLPIQLKDYVRQDISDEQDEFFPVIESILNEHGFTICTLSVDAPIYCVCLVRQKDCEAIIELAEELDLELFLS